MGRNNRGCDRIRSDRNWRFSFLRLHRLGQRNNSGWRSRHRRQCLLRLSRFDQCDNTRERNEHWQGSEIVYTPRLTNAQGTVTDIRLEGADAELFAAEVVDGVVHLTMAKGCTYSTRKTYKVIPVLTFCGQEVTGSTLSIRVTQSTVKLAKLSNRTVYQSQTAPLVQVLSITSPATAEFGEITLNSRSTAALRNAVEAAGGIEVSGGVVRIPAKAFASLKPGRYTVILDVTPENAAADAKPIQARFTLTVQK